MEGVMPKRALILIFEWMELHKDELIHNWESIKTSGNFEKIEPLI